MDTFNLSVAWTEFVEDYTAKLLNPKLLGGTGAFVTEYPLCQVHDHRLLGAVLGLVTQHGAVTFINGLPIMPHDVGYELWSVTIRHNHIICKVVLGDNVWRHKMQKKQGRFNTIAKRDDQFIGLRSLNLPITVEFEGGYSGKRRRD
ncbi:MAG TPA: hypothetical protein VIY48_21590 [Candidatus Paceibacterota bacterium]